jgi:CRISPR-associated protein Csb2
MTRVLRPPLGHAAGTQAVLLGLDAKVLPLVTATVEVAEQIRVRLMGIHKTLVKDPTKVSRKFSGKTCDGTPLRGHQHAFILPLGNECRIRRVLIYTQSESGFDSSEVQAILRLCKLYQSGSEDGVTTVAIWRGCFDDDSVRPRLRVVESRTPFVAPRYWRKGRGLVEDFLKEEVRRECRNHRLPEPSAVETLPKSPELFEWVEFRRNRKDDAPRPGYGFRIEFPVAVRAPFSLGYGCHFGLGQFDKPR